MTSFTVALKAVAPIAVALVSLTSGSSVVAADTTGPKRMVCRSEGDPAWAAIHCATEKPPNYCQKKCFSLPDCTEKVVRTLNDKCRPDDRAFECSPLAVYRTLVRSGCKFLSDDEFWVPATAKLREVHWQKNGTIKEIDWKDKLSCKKTDETAINEFLAVEAKRQSSRASVYAELLRRGCNVDPTDLQKDGRFSKASMKPLEEKKEASTQDRRKDARTQSLQPKSQPKREIQFTPEDPVETATWYDQSLKGICVDNDPLHLPPESVDACKALDTLSGSHRFAKCESGSRDAQPKVEFPDRVSAQGGEVVHLTFVSEEPPPPPLPPPPPPRTSAVVVTGSIGLGALLAWLARWLLKGVAPGLLRERDYTIPLQPEPGDVMVVSSSTKNYSVTIEKSSEGGGAS